MLSFSSRSQKIRRRFSSPNAQAEAGFHVHALDARGHGRSEGTLGGRRESARPPHFGKHIPPRQHGIIPSPLSRARRPHHGLERDRPGHRGLRRSYPRRRQVRKGTVHRISPTSFSFTPSCAVTAARPLSSRGNPCAGVSDRFVHGRRPCVRGRPPQPGPRDRLRVPGADAEITGRLQAAEVAGAAAPGNRPPALFSMAVSGHLACACIRTDLMSARPLLLSRVRPCGRFQFCGQSVTSCPTWRCVTAALPRPA